MIIKYLLNSPWSIPSIIFAGLCFIGGVYLSHRFWVIKDKKLIFLAVGLLAIFAFIFYFNFEAFRIFKFFNAPVKKVGVMEENNQEK